MPSRRDDLPERTTSIARLLEDGINRCLRAAAAQADRLDRELAEQRRLQQEGLVSTSSAKAEPTEQTASAVTVSPPLHSDASSTVYGRYKKVNSRSTASSSRKSKKSESEGKTTTCSASDCSNMADYYYGVPVETIRRYGIRIKGDDLSQVVFSKKHVFGPDVVLPVDVPQPRCSRRDRHGKKTYLVHDPLASRDGSRDNISDGKRKEKAQRTSSSSSFTKTATVSTDFCSSLPTSETILCMSSSHTSLTEEFQLKTAKPAVGGDDSIVASVPSESSMSAASMSEDNYVGLHDFPVYVMEDNKRRVCMARMSCYRRKNSDWLTVNMELDDTSGDPMMTICCELLGILTRNVVVNGAAVNEARAEK